MARPEEKRRGGQKGGYLQHLGTYSGLGLQLALSALLFFYIGYWVDRRLHTMPLFTIVGTFTGAVAAFYRIYSALFPPHRGGKGPGAS